MRKAWAGTRSIESDIRGLSDLLVAGERATTSTEPAGGYGAMSRRNLNGEDCAAAGSAHGVVANTCER